MITANEASAPSVAWPMDASGVTRDHAGRWPGNLRLPVEPISPKFDPTPTRLPGLRDRRIEIAVPRRGDQRGQHELLELRGEARDDLFRVREQAAVGDQPELDAPS